MGLEKTGRRDGEPVAVPAEAAPVVDERPYADKPECLRKVLLNLDKQKAAALELTEVAEVLEAVVEAHGEHDHLSLYAEVAGYSSFHGRLQVSGVVDMGEDVTPIIALIAQHGYKVERFNDSPSAAWRSYTIKQRNDGPGLIKLDAYLAADNAKCEYVKVGEKVEPIYELRCGEELKAAKAEGK